MIFIFFNLLVNSILSIAFGLLIVYFFIWFFRVNTGPWKVFLLTLPFAKIIYDFIRGVPEKSVLFSGIDPFNLPPRHQLLSIGAGFDGWTPFVSAVFSVNSIDGKNYNSSIGDYILFWLNRSFGSVTLNLIVFTTLFISFALLANRVIQYYDFEKRRKRDRTGLVPLCYLSVDWRTVDIYVSPNFSGTPFTGGVINPYICLPEDAIERLSPEELNAVIEHEMGHIRYFDILVTVLIKGLGDLFWFLPGYRWLSRKIDSLREIVADSWAVSVKVQPHLLASALLKLAEIPDCKEEMALYSGFFRERSLLRERIERLVGNFKEYKPRFGWQFRWIRYIATLIISVFVLNSVFGGNFKSEVIREAPKWFENLFKKS